MALILDAFIFKTTKNDVLNSLIQYSSRDLKHKIFIRYLSHDPVIENVQKRTSHVSKIAIWVPVTKISSIQTTPYFWGPVFWSPLYYKLKIFSFFLRPHFLHANQSYLDSLSGLNPDADKHSFYFDVQPITGTTLAAKARIQINLAIKQNKAFNAISQVRLIKDTFLFDNYIVKKSMLLLWDHSVWSSHVR